MKKQLKKKNLLFRIKIINYFINPITIKKLLNLIIKFNRDQIGRYICISNVHSCILSYMSKDFKNAHNSADLALADGRPIFWALKVLNKNNAEHLPGYYVTEKICALANKKKISIGFYGSTKKVLSDLKKKLKSKHKKLKIDYIFSPPFNKISKNKTENYLKKINKSKIDILFVCLGCPKQELWMYNNKIRLTCTMIGIGAASDFLSGNKILPNKIFEYLGLAWMIRLLSEPKRLFWRYFSTNFLFIFLFLLQLCKLKKFK